MFGQDAPADYVTVLQTGGTAGLILFLVMTVVAFTRGIVMSGKAHRDIIDATTKRIDGLTEELARVNQARLDREQKLGDTTVPLLREVSRMLPEAIKGVEAAMAERNRPNELDRALRRLEQVTDQVATDSRRAQDEGGR